MLAKEETIRPDRRLPYTTLGIAIDYRIRYYFCITPAEKLVAWRGADLMVTFGPEALLNSSPEQPPIPVMRPLETSFAKLVQDFFFSLEEKLASLSPNERLLDRCEEEELNRYCFVLALFEEVSRSGLHRTSPLISNGPITTVDELLAIPEPDWVDDMGKMSWLFKERSGDLLSGRAILNPRFDGSRAIGGADADLIVDDCLIEMKATVNPSTSMERPKLYQLLGYVLLDYSDRYLLNSAGFYFVRQGVMARWLLTDLLETLSGGKAPPLKEVREQFKLLVEAEGNPIQVV